MAVAERGAVIRGGAEPGLGLREPSRRVSRRRWLDSLTLALVLALASGLGLALTLRPRGGRARGKSPRRKLAVAVAVPPPVAAVAVARKLGRVATLVLVVVVVVFTLRRLGPTVHRERGVSPRQGFRPREYSRMSLPVTAAPAEAAVKVGRSPTSGAKVAAAEAVVVVVVPTAAALVSMIEVLVVGNGENGTWLRRLPRVLPHHLPPPRPRLQPLPPPCVLLPASFLQSLP